MQDAELETTKAGPEAPGGGVSLATEDLTYLGGAFATIAVIALMGMFWDTLGAVGQLGLTGVVAAASLVAGVVVGRVEGRAARRLQQFLLFIGVAAVGGFAGIAAWHVLDPLLKIPAANPELLLGPEEWAQFVGLLTAAVAGGVVYRRYRYAGPQIAFGIGVAGTAFMGAMLSYGHLVEADGYRMAAALLLVGVIWGVLGLRGLLPPGENTALALSGAMLLVGLIILNSQVQGTESPTALTYWPMYASLGGALLLLVVGVVTKRLITIGFGATGVVVFTPILLGEVFADSIAMPIFILVLGALLMLAGVGAALYRRKPAVQPEPAQIGEEGATASARLAARRIPIATEILAYVGGAFAMGGGIALILGYADQIGIWGQIALCAFAAVTGLAAGLAIGRIDDKGARRLEQFLLAVGTTGAGAMVGLGVFHVVDNATFGVTGVLGRTNAGDWGWFVGAATAAVVGGILWRRRRTWMQQIVFGCAVALSCVTVLGIPEVPGPTWVLGAVLASLGVLWCVLALTGRMEPSNAALVLGSLGIVGGCLGMSIGPEDAEGVTAVNMWALWLGLASTVGLVVLGLRIKRYVMVGIGALGMYQFMPMLIQQVFPDEIAAPIAILIMGVLLIGSGVVLALRTQRDKRASHHVVA